MTRIEGVAAPLLIDDINTDVLIPAPFLITTSRQGLSKGLFAPWREGRTLAPFVLDQPAFAQSVMLLTGENFGCGSSREHAVWALLESGLVAVLAPSFNATFATNAAKNGLAAIVLPQPAIEEICRVACDPDAPKLVRLNLIEESISCETNTWKFDLSEQQVLGLIKQTDDISLALKYQEVGREHWNSVLAMRPWAQPANDAKKRGFNGENKADSEA